MFSEIVRDYFVANDNKITATNTRGREYVFMYNPNDDTFIDINSKTEMKFNMDIFDEIETILIKNKNRIVRGSGRYKVGTPHNGQGTLIGELSYLYYEKKEGQYGIAPLPYLVAIMKKLNLIRNEKGYIIKL